MSERVPQLSVRAILLSAVLAAILAAANAYLGLFAGLTIATAIPAAVVSMAVLRLLGGGTILENNIVQTGASAGSSIAAGVIFTIPALIILGYWQDFRYSWVLAIAGLGGLLGVLFSVPLRRTMIVEAPLAFPEGKAAAEVLKAGENPGPGVKILAMAGAIGAIVKVAAESGMRMIPDNAVGAGFIGRYLGYMGTNLSPALLGVGYIVGLNVGIVVVSGSIFSFNIAIPIYHAFFLSSDPALAARIAGANPVDIAGAIWSAKIRYLGVGAMLIGGVWTLFSLRNSLDFRHQERSRRGAQRHWRSDRGYRARSADEMDADRARRVRDPARVPVSADRRSMAGGHSDDDHHDRRGLSLRVGFGLSGGSGRIVEQSGVRNHDRDDPVRFARARLDARARLADRRRRRDHDRRGGVLRGRSRWRQPAGSQSRLHRRRDAVETAVDADDRLALMRADHGTGAEPSGRGLRHRAADGRASALAVRAAGDA